MGIFKRKATVAVVVVLLFAFAAPALATGVWHPISGTCYQSGDWYISSNVRYTSPGGTTAIKAKFNFVPQKGLVFGVNNYNTGAQMGVLIYSPPLTAQKIAGSQPGGKAFVDKFKLQVAGHQDNYNFSGSQYY